MYNTSTPNLSGALPMATPPPGSYYPDAAAFAQPLPAAAATGPPLVSSHTNSKDPSMVKARVFVGNLNTFRVSREDLVGLFKSCGNVLGATLFKGYAFVQFSSATEAELCVQTLNGYTWEGSELDVKLAFSSPPKSKQVKSESGVIDLTSSATVGSNSSGENAANNASTQTIIDCYYKNKEFAKELPRQPFDAHLDGSLDDVLLCGECRFRTFDINDFADHKSRECSNVAKPPPEPESIQCFTCDNTFESSWKLLQHLTDKHNLNLYRDDDGFERRGPQTPPSPLPSEGVRSEQNALMNSEADTVADASIEVETSKQEIPVKTEEEEENEMLA
uniref:RRM domain-containing protein n=1 Tax=Panagrolaimus superbus TaxID=310955 RepID=A0A914Z4U9_9BILA